VSRSLDFPPEDQHIQPFSSRAFGETSRSARRDTREDKSTGTHKINRTMAIVSGAGFRAVLHLEAKPALSAHTIQFFRPINSRPTALKLARVRARQERIRANGSRRSRRRRNLLPLINWSFSASCNCELCRNYYVAGERPSSVSNSVFSLSLSLVRARTRGS